MHWPLGGFLVASALAHAALFGFPGEPNPDRPAARGPVIVTLLPGPVAVGRESHRQPPPETAPGPRPSARRPAARPPKPEAKPETEPIPESTSPPRPAPGWPAQQPLSPAADEPTPAPPTTAASRVPKTAATPGKASAPAPEPVEDAPPQTIAGSAAAPVDAPLAADFGTADGPRILRLQPPDYPLRALRLRREGRVLLRLELDSSGRLQSAMVIEPAGYGFDASALEAVHRARFAPASRDGRAAPCVALLPITFTLASRL